ncbi:hypothetical protein GWK08_17595 [Leptobacterium flavescens]|uniref:Uncharacterized protein n=1 Tax=Leptobacterium flavescens TaxID=472055 RepID=A0A6P0UQ67_9FLAO|nr:hypothetical protein [Leptobacterium flavescens]NER15275.1 hypothetical protein [Leptobacterium flavescens]
MLRKILNLIKNNFFLIIILGYGIYWVYDYFDTKNKIDNLEYGAKSNPLRKSLNIPVIDNYMNGQNMFRWESWRKKPKDDEVLHVWKNITPSEKENSILSKEMDAFRKRDSNGRVMQLNIYSTVTGDSVSDRDGKFFYYNSEPRNTVDLSEEEIDSISKSWKLNYLVKNGH